MTQINTGVTRRRVLKTIGAAGALAAGPGVASADGRTESPGNAPSDRVSPWPGITEVPVGHWIVHRISILEHWGEDKDAHPGEVHDTKAEAKEAIDDFLAVVDCDASIDGEPVADPNEHWTDPVVHEEEQYVETEWRFVTPPKGRGKSYVYRFSFNQPYDITLPDDALRENQDPENVEIVKRSRGNGNN